MTQMTEVDARESAQDLVQELGLENPDDENTEVCANAGTQRQVRQKAARGLLGHLGQKDSQVLPTRRRRVRFSEIVDFKYYPKSDEEEEEEEIEEQIFQDSGIRVPATRAEEAEEAAVEAPHPESRRPRIWNARGGLQQQQPAPAAAPAQAQPRAARQAGGQQAAEAAQQPVVKKASHETINFDVVLPLGDDAGGAGEPAPGLAEMLQPGDFFVVERMDSSSGQVLLRRAAGRQPALVAAWPGGAGGGPPAATARRWQGRRAEAARAAALREGEARAQRVPPQRAGAEEVHAAWAPFGRGRVEEDFEEDILDDEEDSERDRAGAWIDDDPWEDELGFQEGFQHLAAKEQVVGRVAQRLSQPQQSLPGRRQVGIWQRPGRPEEASVRHRQERPEEAGRSAARGSSLRQEDWHERPQQAAGRGRRRPPDEPPHSGRGGRAWTEDRDWEQPEPAVSSGRYRDGRREAERPYEERIFSSRAGAEAARAAKWAREDPRRPAEPPSQRAAEEQRLHETAEARERRRQRAEQEERRIAREERLAREAAEERRRRQALAEEQRREAAAEEEQRREEQRKAERAAELLAEERAAEERRREEQRKQRAEERRLQAEAARRKAEQERRQLIESRIALTEAAKDKAKRAASAAARKVEELLNKDASSAKLAERLRREEGERRASEEAARQAEELQAIRRKKAALEEGLKLERAERARKERERRLQEQKAREEEEEQKAREEEAQADAAIRAEEVGQPDPRPHFHVVLVGHERAGKSILYGAILHATSRWGSRALHKHQKELGVEETEVRRCEGVELPEARLSLLDVPGSPQYLEEAGRALAEADAALVVLSAKGNEFDKAMKERSGALREHTLLAKGLGARSIVVAVTKMGEVQWSEERFREIHSVFGDFLREVGFGQDDVAFVPVDGQSGDLACGKAPWHSNGGLLECLGKGKLPGPAAAPAPLRVLLFEASKDKKGAVSAEGRVECGELTPGNEYALVPVQSSCKVQAVLCGGRPVSSALAGEAVRLRLEGLGDAALVPGSVLFAQEQPVCAVSRLTAVVDLLDLPQKILTEGFRAVMHIHAVTTDCEVVKLLEASTPPSGAVEQRPKSAKAGQRVKLELELEREVAAEPHAAGRGRLGLMALRTDGRDGRTFGLGWILEVS